MTRKKQSGPAGKAEQTLQTSAPTPGTASSRNARALAPSGA